MSTPFDPVPVDTTQNQIDQAKVQAALAWCGLIDAAATAHVAADTAFLELIQKQPLPINTEVQGAVAADLHYQEDILRASADYQGKVTGWGKGIQVNRSIAARPENADNQELQDSLIFPAPPQTLVTYASANGLPKLPSR